MNGIENIVVIGGGAWGSAIAHQLRSHPQNSIELLVRAQTTAEDLKQGKVRQCPRLTGLRGFTATTDTACLKQADILYLVVPVAAHREMFEVIKTHTSENCPVILCAKGLLADEDRGGIFLQEYAEKELGNRPVALFTGPSFADEVLLGLPTALLVASSDSTLSARVASHFDNSKLRIYQGQDVMGAALGGAVKNVIAIAAGICTGQKLGDNARAGLITRGLAETMRLAEALGASRTTMSGLAGIGDLVLSCSNDHSRNMAYGLALGSGSKISEKLAEGRHSAAHLCARANYENIEMPVCVAVDKIVNHHADIQATITALLSRRAGLE